MIVMLVIGEYRLLLLLTKNYGTLKFFLTQDHMELEVSKRYFSTSFNQMWSKLYQDVAYHGGIQAITFLVINQVLQNLWHFELLTWESVGKPKMWNISKMAGRTASEEKIWDSGSYSVYV